MGNDIVTLPRRHFLELLAGGAMAGLPRTARAQSRDKVLVIGMDIADITSYDTVNGTGYTAPLVYEAAYDTLVTLTPGDYTTVRPALAIAWQRTPDGRGWRLTLRDGVKFNSGNAVTVQDVKWSFDRMINMQGQASQYLSNVADTRIAAANQFDVVLKDPAQPILDILTAPSFVVWERAVLEQQGGVATPDATTRDKATPWLSQHSCGSGAYTLAGWQRNTAVHLERNPHYWRGMPAFERVIIRHLPEPAAQLLAIERGDIDVAFNLIPEQIATVKSTTAKTVRVEPLESLDFIYLAVTANADFNKALAVREARQAIGYAIDYDGIMNGLLGGALRAASFLPIGTLGSTQEVAKQIGFNQDLERAKTLLSQAGFPDGFPFRLSFGSGLIAGVSYAVIAQKLQSDLARVGIKAQLDPLDPVTLRTQFNTGRSVTALEYWNPAAIDNWLWASATVERVAKRVHWTPPPDIVALIKQAADEPDQQKQTALWIRYQKRMVEEANLIVLFQPIYRIAVSNRIKAFPLTAAGWQADIYDAKS